MTKNIKGEHPWQGYKNEVAKSKLDKPRQNNSETIQNGDNKEICGRKWTKKDVDKMELKSDKQTESIDNKELEDWKERQAAQHVIFYDTTGIEISLDIARATNKIDKYYMGLIDASYKRGKDEERTKAWNEEYENWAEFFNKKAEGIRADERKKVVLKGERNRIINMIRTETEERWQDIVKEKVKQAEARGYKRGREEMLKKATGYLWGLPWDDEDIKDFKEEMQLKSDA